MENSSEYYYELLRKAEKPGVTLAKFYCLLYKKDITRSEITMFNRLMGVFSRFTIFTAILDMHRSQPQGMEDPYAYLHEICIRRFESAHSDSILQARKSLDKYIKSIDEEIEKNKSKKLKIPSSEGLE